MTYMPFSFSAFKESDLAQGNLGHGTVFTQPSVATLTISVLDNDAALSGDFYDRALDRHGQHAEILDGGSDIGSGGRLYAERTFHVTDQNGVEYVLVELEQEGNHADYFTYRGAVPPAGSVLHVGGYSEVGHVAYADLGAGATTQNIVAIAAGSDDFNLLVRALATADLVATVQGLTDVTVFAPTDAAFTQLAVDLGFAGDTGDEDAVFDAIVAALTSLAPDGNPVPLLTDVLLYHVSAGAKSAADIAGAGTVATLQGDSFGANGTELIDAEPDIDNPNIVAPDIIATNGVIQGIDRVLLPLDIPGNTVDPEPPTIAGHVAASGGVFDADGTDFDLLLTAVQAAGLAGALDDPDADLTVFAPNDAAFVGLANALGFAGTDEGAAFAYIVDALTLLSGGGDPIALLTDVLLYHVSGGAKGSADVLAATSIDTLLGATLGVDGASLVDNDPDVGNPNLIATDIQAANGIVHVLDGVLLPVDVPPLDGANGVDFVIGQDRPDLISTRGGDDLVFAKGGNDLVTLGGGNDLGLGGDGNDVLLGGHGADTLIAGKGADLVIGGQGADSIEGNNGHDLLRGGLGDDTMNGGHGNDMIFGGAGNDVLDGSGGRDRLVGNQGDDVLTGGAAADMFIFGTSSGNDTVTDFRQGTDLVVLRPLDDFDDVLAHLSDSVDGAVIDFGSSSITLIGVTASQLTTDDFLF